jgi:alkylation response protein AidB-like acyl-CoA dehydrogenase
MAELGRALTPSPMLGTVLATALLVALGDDAAAERLLPRIAAGTVAAVAWADEAGDWGRGAFAVSGDRLTGTAHYVLDGDTAEILLAVADGGVYEVEPGAAQRSHASAMDITRRLATVRLAGAPAHRLGPPDSSAALSAALDETVIALAGEQVGAAGAALELTVGYAKVRHQFGRPIGSFQALKHRMADLHVLLEAARSAAYGAADGTVPPAAAKAFCSEAFHAIAAETIQLHGGIAITWEHDAHLYFKRAHGTSMLFGAPGTYLARLTRELE